MLGCYTDRLSVRPGERFSLYASATHGPCRLEITRIGAADIVVATIDEVAVAEQPIPPNVDRDGCGWSQTLELEVGETWVSGYYDIKLVDAQGTEAHHFVCVKPLRGAPGSRAALVLTTNTYHAYN